MNYALIHNLVQTQLRPGRYRVKSPIIAIEIQPWTGGSPTRICDIRVTFAPFKDAAGKIRLLAAKGVTKY